MTNKSERRMVGEIVRSAREAWGWSRADLAKTCALRGRPVSVQSIYRLESGRVVPSYSTVERVCQVLRIKVTMEAK